MAASSSGGTSPDGPNGDSPQSQNRHQCPWQQRLFGRRLRCCSASTANHPVSLELAEAGQLAEILGVYFGAPDGACCDEFTRHLRQLYAAVNAEENGARKRFEVVQVVPLADPEQNHPRGEDEEENEECGVGDERLAGLPWLAVPGDETLGKSRLNRRFRVKSGVPTLILLDGRSGEVVTRGGVERALGDPRGTSFPWRPAHPRASLADGPLLACGARDSDEPMLHEELRHCFKAVYFSAHWCPPCKAFTPQLIETYHRIRERGHNFEVIFVSSDRSEESYNTHTESMPWLRIPFAQEERRQKLARALDVQAIPTLVILDPRDNIITLEGRTELLEDPEGLNFPWSDRLVNILTEKYATSLHDAPAIILFVEGEDCDIHFGESVLLPTAEIYRGDQPDYDPHHHHHDDDLDDALQFFVALDSETSDILREFIGLEDAVPLLTAIDIPRGVYAVMEDGAEITVDSVRQFVENFRSNKLTMSKILTLHKKHHP